MLTMIITLSITAALVVAFVVLMMPRPKFRDVSRAYARLKESAKIAQKLESEPDIRQLKRMHRLLTICEIRLQDVIDSGLTEVKPALASADEANEIAKSLLVTKADEAKIARLSHTMLVILSDGLNKLIPFAKIYKSKNLVAPTAKTKAEQTLKKYDGE